MPLACISLAQGRVGAHESSLEMDFDGGLCKMLQQQEKGELAQGRERPEGGAEA